MKKLLAIVLAAACVLSLGIVASAANETVMGQDGHGHMAINGAPFNEDWILFDDGANIKGDAITPDQALYFHLGEVGDTRTNEILADKDVVKVKFDKGDDNVKMIKKMSIVEKKLDKGLFAGVRTNYLKIELKDDMTDSEFKLTPSVTFTAKQWIKVNNGLNGFSDYQKEAPEDTTGWAAPGDKLTFELKFSMVNVDNKADQDYAAGDGGVVLKPTKNEDNEITWEDENNTIATLKFVGDDDGKYFYPKLSTKWEDADYAEYFADQDAFIFNFTGANGGNTKIASTSRATLELYNPYYDSDEDDLRVEPENVVIYEIQDDGSMLDVTASFKAIENDDGDYVFQTKTRELGVYILAEKAYTTAADVEAPAEGETVKDVPNTGLF